MLLSSLSLSKSLPLLSSLYHIKTTIVILIVFGSHSHYFRSGEGYFIPPPLGAGSIMLSGSLSIHPKIPSFHLYMGPLVHLTNRDRFSDCPSIRPSARPDTFLGTYRRLAWHESCMLLYPDHLQDWLDYSHDLLIFPFLALFWLSETGRICWAFPGECMEGIACNFACWCILTTYTTG